jgi:hypothetical protein
MPYRYPGPLGLPNSKVKVWFAWLGRMPLVGKFKIAAVGPPDAKADSFTVRVADPPEDVTVMTPVWPVVVEAFCATW